MRFYYLIPIKIVFKNLSVVVIFACLTTVMCN